MILNRLDLNQYEKKIYSQNGEDGITLEVLYRIYGSDLFNKSYVEFGVENGSQCNTRILREYYGWSGLLMDSFYANHYINLFPEFITKENIISLFHKYNISKHFGLLCVDTDLNDFYILHEILKYYCVDVVIIEYNGTFDPDTEAVIEYLPSKVWDGSNYFGASLLSYTKMLNSHGYSLVYVENAGVNAFFVNNKYASSERFININNLHKLYKKPNYGCGPNGGHIQDCFYRKFLTTHQAMSEA